MLITSFPPRPLEEVEAALRILCEDSPIYAVGIADEDSEQQIIAASFSHQIALRRFSSVISSYYRGGKASPGEWDDISREIKALESSSPPVFGQKIKFCSWERTNPFLASGHYFLTVISVEKLIDQLKERVAISIESCERDAREFQEALDTGGRGYSDLYDGFY